ncbi:hypothetical protein ABZ960_23605 [Streptomyces pseudovenezuelae]|uniref:hypothetical protein n=1 Tax=Streptomyces pseudovenezuelae TaxID=67350 RepID=UPI0034A590F2
MTARVVRLCRHESGGPPSAVGPRVRLIATGPPPGAATVRTRSPPVATATAAATPLSVAAWFATPTATPGADRGPGGGARRGAVELPQAVWRVALAARGPARTTG